MASSLCISYLLSFIFLFVFLACEGVSSSVVCVGLATKESALNPLHLIDTLRLENNSGKQECGINIMKRFHPKVISFSLFLSSCLFVMLTAIMKLIQTIIIGSTRDLNVADPNTSTSLQINNNFTHSY